MEIEVVGALRFIGFVHIIGRPYICICISPMHSHMSADAGWMSLYDIHQDGHIQCTVNTYKQLDDHAEAWARIQT